MSGSLKVCRVAGIGIYVHWSFLLLIGWVVYSGAGADGRDLPEAFYAVLLVTAVFGCVVLHELGHALTAKRFGIATRDITLLPIGGVARLERMPDDPGQELSVALAGPMVNVVIAACLLVGLLLGWIATLFYPTVDFGILIDVAAFVGTLTIVNLILVGFNLVPAFPMDGGRVLRAVLALKLDYVRATRIAAVVGQTIAILLGGPALVLALGGFPPAWFWVLIAAFVYLGARQESQMVRVRAVMKEVPTCDIMITRFRTLAPSDGLEQAVDAMRISRQHDFPVLDEDRIVGILTRTGVLAAIASGHYSARVGQVMQADCHPIDAATMLDVGVQQMHQTRCSALPVVSNGELVGLISLEGVSDWLTTRAAFQKGAGRKRPEPTPAEPAETPSSETPPC